MPPNERQRLETTTKKNPNDGSVAIKIASHLRR